MEKNRGMSGKKENLRIGERWIGEEGEKSKKRKRSYLDREEKENGSSQI